MGMPSVSPWTMELLSKYHSRWTERSLLTWAKEKVEVKFLLRIYICKDRITRQKNFDQIYLTLDWASCPQTLKMRWRERSPGQEDKALWTRRAGRKTDKVLWAQVYEKHPSARQKAPSLVFLTWNHFVPNMLWVQASLWPPNGGPNPLARGHSVYLREKVKYKQSDSYYGNTN